MSDRKRECKASKSSYMRAVRKQRAIEDRYAAMNERCYESRYDTQDKKKKSRPDCDDSE